MKTTNALPIIIDKISTICNVSKRDMGEYSHVHKKGMDFIFNSYEAEGLGYFCTIEMSAMLGLMKMDTFVFTPVSKDAPLFSFDRINAMGKDNLMIELYNLCIEEPKDLSALDKTIESLSDITEGSVPERWYDYLRLPQSTIKNGKKCDSRYISALSDYFDKYIEILKASPDCDEEEKLKKIDFYVDGLFTKGSPTVEQFEKLMPKEDAYKLYSKFVFSSRPNS